MTRSTSRALRRVLAVAAGLAVGVGASVLDGTGARAADPPDVVCVDQPQSITYVPAPGARPITVPACAPPAPAPPPAPEPTTRPRAAATSWRALADAARQRRQEQIAAERAGHGTPRHARSSVRTSSSTSTGRCREIHVEGTDQHGRPRQPLRICR